MLGGLHATCGCPSDRILIPADFSLFKDTDGERLNKIKMLAEIQEIGPTGELGELLEAEIRQEKNRRSTANGVADLITWTLCGLVFGWLVVLTHRALVEVKALPESWSNVLAGWLLGFLLLLAGILMGLRSMRNRGTFVK